MSMPDLLLEPVLQAAESRVLLHLARGVPRRELPGVLKWSLSSVDGLLDAIYRKLQRRSATGAVIAGHEYGLLPREVFEVPRLFADELELLGLIGAGLSQVQVAERLGVPYSTSATRTQLLYRLLGARNRPNAVHVGFCTGLLGGDVDAS